MVEHAEVSNSTRPVRVDARRNVEALLEAAGVTFVTDCVDAPVRQIATRAGVGVGTVYRHFPHRSDLVKAVFRREVDECAQAAPGIAEQYEPGEALTRWLLRYTEFLAAKRGLAAALHSGDVAYESLPAYFMGRLGPTLQRLLHAAVTGGDIRPGFGAQELLYAVSNLCLPVPSEGGDPGAQSARMVKVLIDGMRYTAPKAPKFEPRPDQMG